MKSETITEDLKEELQAYLKFKEVKKEDKAI